MDKINLYYKDANSDKVYNAQIEPQGAGYIVQFQYGKRASTLITGIKTPSAVSLEEAQKVLAGLKKAKVSKGYTEDTTGVVFQSSELAERVTNNVPQLLNPFPQDDVKKEALLQDLLTDDAWLMQEKHDGRRIMVKKEGKEVSASNKKALSVSLPPSVVARFESLSCNALFDGELMAEGDKYFIFDLLELEGVDLRALCATERLDKLSSIQEVADMVTLTLDTTNDKLAFFEKLKTNKKQKKEGVVFKKKDSKYVPGRPNSGGNQRKYKFMEDSTVLVVSHNPKKRSVGIGAFDDNQQLVLLGSITIYPNQDMPAVGAIIDITYMHCFRGGSVYVGKMKCVRDDQDKSDCLLSQIKFKDKSDEDDDS